MVLIEYFLQYKTRFVVLGGGLMFLVLESCVKLDLVPIPFVGETSIDIDPQTGIVHATSYLDDFEAELSNPNRSISDHGHVWGLEPDPEIPVPGGQSSPVDRSSLGSLEKNQASTLWQFRSQATRLLGNTTYYIRPYVIFNDGQPLYGKSESFQTGFRAFVDLVFVQGGERFLGDSLEVYDPDERPADAICLDDFAIGRYEVSRAFYDAVMGTDKSGDCPNCPVNNVSWIEAKLFVEELNRMFDNQREFILPSEAQWEYAARGGSKALERYTYSGSNELEEVGWHFGNSGSPGQGMVREIGLLEPNSLGIYDMTGNLNEWCEDWWGLNVYQERAKKNPVNDGVGTGKTSVRKTLGPDDRLSFFDPERSKQWLVDNLDFTDLEAEAFFYLGGTTLTANVQSQIAYFPKVCRGCYYADPDDSDNLCRISRRISDFGPNQQSEAIGFRIAEKL